MLPPTFMPKYAREAASGRFSVYQKTLRTGACCGGEEIRHIDNFAQKKK